MIRMLAMAIGLTLLAALPLTAQTHAPPAAAASASADPSVSAFDHEPLTPPSSPSAADPGGGGAGGSGSDFGLARVGLALAAVLGLVFALRWAVRRMFGQASGAAGGGVVSILSRTVVSPKQQLVLVQVGRRLLLVADAGTRMNALCQITDPQEVADLLGQIRGGRGGKIEAGKNFVNLFGKARQEFDDLPGGDGGDDGEPLAATATGPAADAEPELNRTRQELSGLTDRIRTLARQLGRPQG